MKYVHKLSVHEKFVKIQNNFNSFLDWYMNSGGAKANEDSHSAMRVLISLCTTVWFSVHLLIVTQMYDFERKISNSNLDL